MMGRNKRGLRRASVRVRLAVAAAVLVGGGAAGVVAVASSHGGAAKAESAGYDTNSHQTLSEATAMSTAMNWWSTSPQTSLTVITEMVTIRTVSTTTFHHKTFAVQRGIVVTKDPWEFVAKSTNGQFELWHANNGTKFVNIGGSQTGWNAMSGGMMSQYGNYNWSNMSNSTWNMTTKTLANGDLVFVFGQRVHGLLHAQLVLYAAPGKTGQSTTPNATPTWKPTPSSNMPTFAGSNS